MSKLNHKTILFDMDGTLYNSIPTIVSSFREVFECMGETYPGDVAIKNLIGTHLHTIIGSFLPPEKIEEGVTHYRRIYLASQEKGVIQLFPEVLPVLKQLEQKKYTMGIVTTKSRVYSLKLLEKSGIMPYFKVFIGSEDVTRHKPLPDPLLKATNNLSIEPNEAVYIGDALIDLAAARAAKMDFIAVTTGTTSEDAFLKNKQNAILPNLEKLPLYL